MELKTLKDIDEEKTYDKGNGVVGVERVRQEGIKWVKYYQNTLCGKDWWKFFNITEEELKGGNQDGNKTRKN